VTKGLFPERKERNKLLCIVIDALTKGDQKFFESLIKSNPRLKSSFDKEINQLLGFKKRYISLAPKKEAWPYIVSYAEILIDKYNVCALEDEFVRRVLVTLHRTASDNLLEDDPARLASKKQLEKLLGKLLPDLNKIKKTEHLPMALLAEYEAIKKIVKKKYRSITVLKENLLSATKQLSLPTHHLKDEFLEALFHGNKGGAYPRKYGKTYREIVSYILSKKYHCSPSKIEKEVKLLQGQQKDRLQYYQSLPESPLKQALLATPHQ